MSALLEVPDRLPILPTTPLDEGADARVRRLFPTLQLRQLDPFVVLDEFRIQAPAGFPTHPHRGFEAITYMLEGAFRHEDDLGNASLVEAGGAQRFTAGRGLMHSEMPGAPGLNHGLQLWVNLPRRLKDVSPSYQQVIATDLPEERAGGVTVRTVVGPGSPLEVMTPLRYVDVALEAGALHMDAVEQGWNGFVYAVEGEIRLGDEILTAGRGALPGPGPLHLRAHTPARALIVAGQPHREPIVQRGPYVC